MQNTEYKNEVVKLKEKYKISSWQCYIIEKEGYYRLSDIVRYQDDKNSV